MDQVLQIIAAYTFGHVKLYTETRGRIGPQGSPRESLGGSRVVRVIRLHTLLLQPTKYLPLSILI